MARYDDDDDEGHIDMRPLLRLAVWGACAVVAVGGTVMAGRTEVGGARAKVAMATLRAAPSDAVNHPANMLANHLPVPDEYEKRLAEQVRALTTDRDRLAERVATLEQNLTDLTGSVARAAAAKNATSNDSAANAPPEKAEPPAAVASAESQRPPSNPAGGNNDDQATPPAPQPGVGLPADVPLPRRGPLATIQSYVNATAPPPARQTRVAAAHAEPPTPPAATGGIAIDLGSATNINTLRAHWGAVKAAHGAIVAGLQPLVSVRQSARPGFTEFHLVAGPVTDADAAARLCAALTSVRVPCRPSTFNGQRLDLR